MYRERRRQCPGCQTPMDELPVLDSAEESAMIDHCAECGGVFLEFFDGDPGELCRGVLARALEHAGENNPPAWPTCPDCQLPMAPQRTISGGSAIARCNGCMGLFATPAQLRELAAHVETEQPDPSRSLLERLKSFFAGGNEG